MVVHCHAHRQAFTLYPPGYSPYARRSVTKVAPDGGLPRAEEQADKAERFRGTLFDAAIDAGQGRAWSREHEGATDHWWGTQLRQLDRALVILGLAAAVDSALRHLLAEMLAIPTLVLEEQATSLRAANVGYRERGAAVRAVLGRLAPTPLLADRLLEAGHLAGCWGAPHRWLPDIGGLRRCPFRAAVRRGTAAPRRPP